MIGGGVGGERVSEKGKRQQGKSAVSVFLSALVIVQKIVLMKANNQWINRQLERPGEGAPRQRLSPLTPPGALYVIRYLVLYVPNTYTVFRTIHDKT